LACRPQGFPNRGVEVRRAIRKDDVHAGDLRVPLFAQAGGKRVQRIVPDSDDVAARVQPDGVRAF
jgi:hypothetical protein